MMKSLKIISVLVALISLTRAQMDGSFWWKNKDLVNKASQSRSLKDQNAKIRTLPPRYRHEDESTSTTTRIFTDESEEEDHANYKYNNEPDCVCVPRYLCNQDNILITDGAGIINER
jgi:Serine protease Clip domain PPAF-2